MGAPFAPGDVVVCVDNSLRGYHTNAAVARKHLSLLRLGVAYRVGATGICPTFGEPYVSLDGAEIDPAIASGFNPDRFRKIDDEVTEAFRERLRSLPKQKVQV